MRDQVTVIVLGIILIVPMIGMVYSEKLRSDQAQACISAGSSWVWNADARTHECRARQ
jgi:hypothetical protein